MKNLTFRAKITPKKIGQFVSIWKRDTTGITIPHDIGDDFEYMVIELENSIGAFVFPKEILLEKQIISGKNSKGKNGIRVYPPNCKVLSKQALATQKWQIKYFIPILSTEF